MKKVIQNILYILIQIIIYLAVYKIGWALGSNFKGNPKDDLFWGITLKYAFLTFTAISIFGTILSEFLPYNKSKKDLVVFILSFFLFFLLFINNFNFTPYKTILLIFSALMGFIAKWKISFNNTNTTTN